MTSASPPHVTVDARMLGSSGIGTYLAELLPRVVAAMESARFTLLGHPRALASAVPATPRVCHRRFEAPIYSVREQIGFTRVIPPDTNLVWSPHYNIPIAHRGALVVTVHDVNHLSVPEPSLPRQAYARAMFGTVRRRAAVVLCDSGFTAREFARLVGLPRELLIARLGVGAQWTAAAEESPPANDPYFLFVGNVKPHKNLVRLLDAFARLPADVRHRLVIVGRGEGLRTIDTRVAGLVAALGDRVACTGFVPQAELLRLMRRCDALVLPSLVEGFGLPPLEALGCGRPVAVSRVASLPEVCGPMAEYFDPLDVGSIADALTRVARRPPDSAEVVARRQAWARDHDWNECAAITSGALARAIGAASATTPPVRSPA